MIKHYRNLINFKNKNSQRSENSNQPSAKVKFTLKILQKINHGSLKIECPDEKLLKFGSTGECVNIKLKNWNPFSSALKSGNIGFAESYIKGEWHTDNLPKLLEFFILNKNSLHTVFYGSLFGKFFYRIKHYLNENSIAGSKRNIHRHYNLGNNFYKLWLDKSMTYSGGLFVSDDISLEQAQDAKYQRVIEQINLNKNKQILEIGCGWGGFAEKAAQIGSKITAISLSEEQLKFAKLRLKKNNLLNKVDLKFKDYREIKGNFDSIVSIEMFEAVGEKYWDLFFKSVHKLLSKDGKFCIQTITIDDSLFARYRDSTDFIQQYIFPGGMLSSPSIFKKKLIKHNFKIIDEFAFGNDYAKTLSIWRKKFLEEKNMIKKEGFDEYFLKKWEFYFAYCEAGFRTGSLNLYQFTLMKN